MPSQKFGQRLRELRENSGMNQREVAEKVGIDSTYLSKLESGSTVTVPPSEKMVERLAKVLGADENQLMTLASKVPSSMKTKSTLALTLAFLTGGIGILLLVFGLLSFLKPVPKDSEGFISTWTLHAGGRSAALLVKAATAQIDAALWGKVTTFKVKVSGKNPSGRIFIGTANQSDIESYLETMAYQQVSALHTFPYFAVSAVDQNPAAGGRLSDPTSQSFWDRTAYGTGTQELVWELEPNHESLVVINTDGFLDADIVFATPSQLSKIFGFGYLLATLVLLLLSVFTFGLPIKARNLGGFPV